MVKQVVGGGVSLDGRLLSLGQSDLRAVAMAVEADSRGLPSAVLVKGDTISYEGAGCPPIHSLRQQSNA